MRYIRILTILIIFAFLSFGFSQDDFRYAQPGEYWIIMTDAVPVMRTPETYPTTEEIIRNMVGIISKNTKVKVLDTKGWIEVWSKVLFTSSDGNTIGWVMASVVKSAKKVSGDDSKTVSSKWGLIRYTHSKANVRESRSTKSKVVTQLNPNQKVKADFLKNNWYAVFNIDERYRSESNSIGYVHSSLLYPQPKTESKKTTLSKKLLSYKIVKKEDQSYRGTSRMTYRVLLNVTTKPKEQEIKDVAISLWEDDNKSWKEFTVFLYLPEMNTNSTAYGVANFTPIGLKDFNVQEYALFGTKWQKK